MTTDKDPPEDFRGFAPAIFCPRCGKNAVLLNYDDETGVAWYLHVTKNRKKWHAVQISKA